MCHGHGGAKSIPVVAIIHPQVTLNNVNDSNEDFPCNSTLRSVNGRQHLPVSRPVLARVLGWSGISACGPDGVCIDRVFSFVLLVKYHIHDSVED